MYTKLMVAIDGSETSKRALTEAVRVARAADAGLHVAHVIDQMSLFGYGVNYASLDFLDAFREEGARLLADARREAESAGVRCETELLELESVSDDVAPCLERCARRCGAQLVVIGTQGRRGAQRVLLGSVAEQFVRIAPCPVLLVRYPDTGRSEPNGRTTP